MKFNLVHVFTFFSVILVGSHAVTPEAYWNSVLPNSRMPKAVIDLLYTTEGKSTRKQVKLTNVVNLFYYSYAATDDQLKDYENVVVFFLENDLHHGAEMNLHFIKNNNQKGSLLPKKLADSIPFSSKNISQIYNKFSIQYDSMEAKIMKQTLDECEELGIEGEEKYCATSLESMVDFTTTNLGQKVKAISTEVNAQDNTPLQKYKIEEAKKLVANKAVVCHNREFAYAVFYCHKTVGNSAYVVSLVGVDGTKVKAVAVCHSDTLKWNPKHLAFQLLKVTPGSVPVCHFLPEDHIGWVPY